jgi:hypothetical protein
LPRKIDFMTESTGPRECAALFVFRIPPPGSSHHRLGEAGADEERFEFRIAAHEAAAVSPSKNTLSIKAWFSSLRVCFLFASLPSCKANHHAYSRFPVPDAPIVATSC